MTSVPGPIARSTFSLRTGMAVLGSMPKETQLDLALGTLADAEPIDPILHELMHHNAANSAVNVALQYRWLELLRVVLSTPGHHVDDRISPMVGQLAAAELLLQPLAEGLALFAEFDCCVPDPSLEPAQRVITAIDQISLRLLSLKSHLGNSRRTAIAEKTSAGAARRRADVLVSPLYPRTANDAYLLGYLVVKAAWTRYLESTPATRWPAGAFAEFVHYWFYEDWRLAELLLHGELTGEYAVAGNLGQRIRRLLDSDLPARVDAFTRDKAARAERGMLPRGPEERKHGPFAGLDVSMADLVDTQHAFWMFDGSRIAPSAPITQGPLAEPESRSDHLHNLLVTTFGDDQEQTIRAYYERNPSRLERPLRMLDFLLEIPKMNSARAALLDLSIEVRIDGERLTALRVEGTTQWREPPGVVRVKVERPGHRLARLLGMLSSKVSPWRFGCFVVIDGFVRASWSFGKPDLDEHRGEIERINYYEAFRSASGISQEDYLTQALNAALTDADALDDSVAEATLAVSMAMREALTQRGWDGLFALSPAVEDNGIRELLGGPAMRALAATGLVNSFATARAEVTKHLSAQGYDLDALIAICDRAACEYGVQLLVADADHVRARI